MSLLSRPQDREAPLSFANWRVAVCIGHSRPGDNGAVSAGGVSEWDYNRELGRKLIAQLQSTGIEGRLIETYHGSSYASAMRWLGKEVGRLKCDAAIELHFNAAGKTAHGYEYLHYQGSRRGEKLAHCFHSSHAMRFPDARSRGVKPVTSAGRGGMFLRVTPCPAAILEPFFGTNENEWEHYNFESGKLASTYAAALDSFFKAD